MRIPQADTILWMGVLVAVPDLEARPLRGHVGDIEPVAVPEPGAPHDPAIMIDRNRTMEDLVKAVSVNIGHVD